MIGSQHGMAGHSTHHTCELRMPGGGPRDVVNIEGEAMLRKSRFARPGPPLLVATAIVVGAFTGPVWGAEIKVLSASALKVIVTDLAGKFHGESGHVLKLEFATAGAVERRVLENEAVDVMIATDI